MEFQGTVLAQQQERKLVKSLRRADVLLFIVDRKSTRLNSSH